MLRENLKKTFKDSGLVVKEIAAIAGVPKRTIDKWMELKSINPGALDLYRVAKAEKTTVEALVDGETGRQYLLDLLSTELRPKEVLPAGISPEAMEIARAADRLSTAGKQAAFNQVEALTALFPYDGTKIP
jgi:transcriptional regulator with XRE-family HTH domain